MSVDHNHILSLRNFSANYGHKPILSNITFAVDAGEIVALIGPNGAGKSTLLKAVVGLVASSGTLDFGGRTLNGLAAAERIALGISYCPQGNRVFAELSVYENLEIAGHGLPRRQLRLAVEKSLSTFRMLKPLSHRRAGVLSGGEQQVLALARALICEPKLLMLDEPTAGLTPLLTKEILAMTREIASGGVAILMVEQKIDEVLEVSDKVILLKSGQTMYHGPSAELAANEVRLSSFFLD